MASKNLPTLTDFLSENFSVEQAESIKASAQDEFLQLQNLLEDVSRIVAKFMAKEQIGFNEMVRRLGMSPSQFSKIQRGDGNITLATLAHIARTGGFKVRIEAE